MTAYEEDELGSVRIFTAEELLELIDEALEGSIED